MGTLEVSVSYSIYNLPFTLFLVIKSMMAEVTDSTNIAQAYAYMPIAWSTGGTIGQVFPVSL